MTTAALEKLDIRDIEAFLYREADCLDRTDLDAWIELYAEDGSYWMPVTPDQPDPFTHISLFYDDRLLMEIRRINFTQDASSLIYAVRSSHIIGNVRIKSWDGEIAEVTSNFHAAFFYRGEQTLYAGRYTHTLRKNGDSWLIQRKRVDILNADQPLKSLVLYL